MHEKTALLTSVKLKMTLQVGESEKVNFPYFINLI